MWGKLEGHHGGGHHQQQQQYQQPQQPQQQQYQAPQQPPSYDYGKQEQGPQSSEGKEEKKHWYDSDGAKIAAGVLGGLGVIGAGAAIYKHHEHKEEARESFEAWASAAKARKEQFRARGPQGPATWLYNEGKGIPQGAISTGTEHDWTLYICRAYMDGGVQIGKASDVFQKGAVIGYQNEEHQLDKYEILLGSMQGLKWVQTGNTLNVESLGARPVEGGYENDGTKLYVVRAYHKGAMHPGKASEKLDGAFIPYDGKEKKVKEYEVLCYV